jgi:two-component system sensor kinase
MMNSWVSPILPWLVTTYRLQWQNSTEQNVRRQMSQNARNAAREALKVARKFQTDLPHALREAGLVAAMRGSHRRARKWLDESLDVAERQGAQFEYAQTLLARGIVGLRLGWAGAREEVAEGKQAVNGLGANFANEYFGASD